MRFFITTIILSLLLALFPAAGIIDAARLNTSLAPTDLKSGLIGWWTLDAPDMPGNNAIDRSGNGYTLAKTGTISKTRGKIGQGILMSNAYSNSYYSVDNADFTYGTSTVSLWIKPKSFGASWQDIFNMQVSDLNRIHLLSNVVYWYYIMGDSGGISIQSSALSANNWYHVAAVFDGTTARLYLNMVLQGSAVPTSKSITASNIMIGHSSELYNGTIDDVRVWNRALSVREIQQLYKMGGGKINKTIAPTDLKSGLVGHWTFDGPDVNATQVLDKSGQGNTGTRNGSMVMGKGKIGQAGKFDGGDDWVNVGNAGSTLTDNFTLSAWVKGDKKNTRIIARRGGLTQWEIYTDSALGRFSLYDGVAERISSTIITDNKWHFVATVINGANSAHYVDGVKSGSSFSPTITAQTLNTEIGSNTGGLSNWRGSIDDVRVYNRALSVREIQALYKMGKGKINKTLTPTDLKSGLVGHWTFDGADVNASQVLDKSGQGNNGTRNGSMVMAKGKIGQAGKFDGADDYVGKTDFNASQANIGSLSAWFKAGATQKVNARIVEMGASADRVGYFIETNKRIQLYLVKAGVVIANPTTAATMNDNLWHYVVGTWDSSAAKLYIDGVLVDSTAGDKSLDLGGSVNMFIGEYVGGAGYEFNGLIDDVRVYSRALSAQEIKQLYQMGR